MKYVGMIEVGGAKGYVRVIHEPYCEDCGPLTDGGQGATAPSEATTILREHMRSHRA